MYIQWEFSFDLLDTLVLHGLKRLNYLTRVENRLFLCLILLEFRDLTFASGFCFTGGRGRSMGA